MRVGFFAIWLAGCTGSGSLDLVLSLPKDPALRPEGMTRVTVTATLPGHSPVSTESAIENNAFTAGEVPAGADVQIGVVLKDVSNRIVGVGDAGRPISIARDEPTEVTIEVRRPFVYAPSIDALYTFDPTRDPRDAMFQRKLEGVAAAQLMISVGGDLLAVVSDGQVQIVVSATNAVTGAISVPVGVTDAAPVPGTHKIAVAHGSGIAIVDLDTRTMNNVVVGPIDRVTVGPGEDGAMYAYGLVDRVLPLELPKPLAMCSPTAVTPSSVVAVNIATLAPSPARSLGQEVSDLAASPDAPKLYATLPCKDSVAQIAGDPAFASSLMLSDVTPLPRASVLTVAGGRVFAAGTKPAVPRCNRVGGACDVNAPIVCREGIKDMEVLGQYAYASEAAQLVIASIPTSGGPALTVELPGRTETVQALADPALELSSVMRALAAVPLDLVALPGNQYVGVITTNRYNATYLADAGAVIVPCFNVRASDWLLIDMANASFAQEVRSSCELTVGGADYFAEWQCAPPLPGHGPLNNIPYVPQSVGAMFGAR
jgi:hypothetical protein